MWTDIRDWMGRHKAISWIAGVMIFLSIIGLPGGDDAEVEPINTVKPEPIVKTKTKTVTKTVMPKSCKDLVEVSSQLSETATRLTGINDQVDSIISDVRMAQASGDASALVVASESLKAASAEADELFDLTLADRRKRDQLDSKCKADTK